MRRFGNAGATASGHAGARAPFPVVRFAAAFALVAALLAAAGTGGAQEGGARYAVDLVARWTETDTQLDEPVYWRVLQAEPDPFETQPLQASGVGPSVRVNLPPGRYIVTATLGRVVRERPLDLWSPRSTPFEVVFDAGIALVRARRIGAERPLGHSMSWRAYPAGAAADAQPVGDDFAAVGRFVLPAGRYRVVAVDGIARGETEIEVVAGETREGEVAFDAGEIAMRARLGPESPAIRQGVRWRVFGAEDDAAPTRDHEVASQLSPSAIFRLPSGDYWVRADFGHARGETRVTVESGVRREAFVDLDAGLLRAEARLRTGGQTPLGDIEWTVVRDEDGVSVADSLSESGVFTLNAGRYRVAARVGLVAAETLVTVETGALHEVEVELRAARVEVEGVLEGTAAPTEGPLLWRLFAADAPRNARPLETLEAEVAVFVLPAGSYRIVGSNRQGEGERTFTLAPGREQRLQLPVRAHARGTSSRTSPGRPPRD